MNKTTPDLFIVGVAKCGTSSLHDYLNLHPDINMSEPKEPHYMLKDYFNRFDLKGPGDRERINNYSLNDSYFELFNDEILINGESSPGYFSLPEYSIPKIKEINPSSKIIIILRNPVERVFSSYLHKYKQGLESFDFDYYIKNYKEIIKSRQDWSFGFSHIEDSYYYLKTKLFVDNFDNIKIILFDDLISNRIRILNETFEFLDITTDVHIDKTIHSNPTEILKFKKIGQSALWFNKKLHIIIPNKLKDIVKSKIYHKPKISNNSVKLLRKRYKEDVVDLSKLINRDLEKLWFNNA